MRISSTLLKSRHARIIPHEPVPFKEILPLKLKAGVSGKGQKTSEACCIYEMSVMFACLKDNDFQQSMCGKEIESFQKCYSNNMKEKAQRKERDLKGVLTPGEKDLTAKQLNMLLQKYPNV